MIYKVRVIFTVEAEDESKAFDIVDTELTEGAAQYPLAVFDPIISSVIVKVDRKHKPRKKKV